MFAQDERRIRHRECLELEAQYGQFLPCETYEDPDDLNVGSRPTTAAFSHRHVVQVLVDGLRAARDAIRTFERARHELLDQAPSFSSVRPFAQVELFLSLLGLSPFGRIKVELGQGEHKAPPFLTVNRFERKPVIKDSSVVLADSNAILVSLASSCDPGRR